MNFKNSLKFARRLDEDDVLKKFRNEFIIPELNKQKVIYFLGNSLGLQPKRTKKYINRILKQWGKYGVEGFFKSPHPWLNIHQQLAGMASKIVGALPNEVVIMNQLTINLHLMLTSFYQPQNKRTKILCEAKAFPSDQYMLHTHVQQRGLDPDVTIIEVQPRAGEMLIREEDIHKAIEENKNELALIFWGGVNYYTGQVFNMQSLTIAAHNAGAKIGFDLAHAAGNVPLQLHKWDVDFACWCNYKYLNSGPGAVAGCYVHERYHNDTSLNRLAGWWGQKKETQFLMPKNFTPEPTAEGWQISTPSPALYAAHKAALEIFEEAGLELIFQKAQVLNDYLLFLLNEVNEKTGKKIIKIVTPQTKNEKGAQVSLQLLRNGKNIFDYLISNGVFADWREPEVIRIAPVALYNTFEEIWQFAQLTEKAIQKYSE